MLFAGLLLAAVAVLALAPLFPCPPCRGSGFVNVISPEGNVTFCGCTLCLDHGRVGGWTWLRADPAPDPQRGVLRAPATVSGPER